MSITVVTPATDVRLTTLEAVKAEISGASNEYLEAAINQASAAIASWCGRTLGLETIRERIELEAASPSIVTDRWPVTELVSLTRCGVVVDVVATEFDQDKGLLLRLDGDGNLVDWPSGSLTFTYRTGYLLPNQGDRTLPRDIERAAIVLIKGYWYARNRDPQVRSETFEIVGYEADFFSSLPPEVERLLIPHRKLTIG